MCEVLLVASLLPASANASDQKALDGYSWLHIPDINASVLMPDGWHYRFNQAKLRGSFVISREPPTPGEGVVTGLVVYMVNNMSKTNGRPLGGQVADYVKNLQERSENTAFEQHQVVKGRFKGVSLRFENNDAGIAKVVQRLYLADERTDELLIVTFTVPLADWPDQKETAAAVLQSLSLSE